jgi:adenine-specific DNA-methyltransferase
MKLIQISHKKALKKLANKKPFEDELAAFKQHFIEMLDTVNELEQNNKKESEEHLKNIVSRFLQITFYKKINEVNTNYRNDLVIYLDAPKKTVGVIIEAKRPTNTDQMISAENLNKKALWELIYYYLEEKKQANNFQLKHLIATNIYEWYIIDAEWFDKNIYKNSDILKLYDESKRKSASNDFFYSEIPRLLTQSDVEIPCIYFNIKKIESSLRKETSRQSEIISIYKLLSPDFLLGLENANDSNSLNTAFYKELLHVIGLEETTEGTKNVIKRKKPDNRDSGSLIELTIKAITSEDIIRDIPDKSTFGTDKETIEFNIALELCITWINRILFLKLLEGQLISYHGGNKADYQFLNPDKHITDFDGLFDLFHKVLAINTNEREEPLKSKYKHVPYLNSSLFDFSILERQSIKINSLAETGQIQLLSTTILKDLKKQYKHLSSIKYLLKFLGAYDFGSNEDEETINKDKPIINASVLGKVFEKINGYKDGSIFTPSFITMYMCKQSIRLAIAEKFKEAFPDENLNSFDAVKNFLTKWNETAQIRKANEIIDSIKICDPAVGSGHFLVSALNELIAIKSELNILADESGQRVKNFEIANNDDELQISDLANDNEPAKYRIINGKPQSERIQHLQKTLCHQKQTIIENCLFGVDINSKSVLICQLRLWIELLKNAYYKESDYTELETLPNIDINIKCGNSLISRFDLKENISIALKSVKYNTAEYREKVYLYKNEKNRNAKRELQDVINKIKGDLKTEIIKSGREYSNWYKAKGEHEKLTTQFTMFEHTAKEKKAFEEKIKEAADKLKKNETILENIRNNAIYKNALEWRIEFPEVLNDSGDFMGFDVVIGNPPYFSLSKDINNNHYKEHYQTFNSGGDIYCLFYELGNRLLATNRYLVFITSNKWMRATYGKYLRNYLINNTNPLFLFDFSWYQVFENASVDTNILLLSNTDNKFKTLSVEAKSDFDIKELPQYINQNAINIAFKTDDYWAIKPPLQQALKTKLETLGRRFEEWDLKINRGLLTGFNKGFLIDKKTKDDLIEADIKNAKIIVPLLRGRDIERYGYSFNSIYLINTYNGYTDTVIDVENDIIKHGDNDFLYKSANTGQWHSAYRIEISKGNSIRVNRVIAEIDYPFIYTYLKQFQPELEKREDQGDHWSNLRNCAYNDEFLKEKLVWAETMRIHKSDTQNFPRFGYDDEGYYADKTVFIGVGNHVKYLLAFFNSNIGRWLIKEYVTKLDTGGYMMQKVFLDEIPVLEIDEAKEVIFNQLVDSIIMSKKSGLNNDITKDENEIDHLLYSLYQLTPEEITIVES